MNESDPCLPPAAPAPADSPAKQDPPGVRQLGGPTLGEAGPRKIAAVPPARAAPALGEDPDDREAVKGFAGVIEALLRHPRRVMHRLRGEDVGRVGPLALAAGTGLIAGYGVIVGSFSGGTQWWAAPLKIAGGTFATAVICLPSLYVFATLSGSRARLGELAGALCGLIALVGILLIGFAPVAWLFSQSTTSEVTMGCLHLAFWAVAARFGLKFVHVAAGHFGVASRGGLWVWSLVFVLVSLQMTAALRPLVGTGETLLPAEKRFFAAHWRDCINPMSPAPR